MDRRSLLKVSALAPALAFAPAAGAQPATRDAAVESVGPARPRYAEATARLRACIAEHRRVHALPALTFVAVDADGWRCAIDSGTSDWDETQPLRPDHLFQVGSISKSITALALWRAAEQGRLDLNGDARPLLPDVPWPEAKISVRNLLEHSSGLPDDAPAFPRGGDGRLWTGFPPGTHWSYSNTGYAVLGMILERVHRRRLGAVLEAEVLRPLGMATARGAILAQDRALYPASRQPFRTDAVYAPGGRLAPAPWVDMVQGSGCVAAPSREMAAYLRWLIGAASGRGGGRLLPADKAAAFCRPTIDAPAWHGGGRYGNGLATVQADGRSLLHHTGGMISFNSAFHVDAAAGVGAFASTPVGMIPYRPRAITLYACGLLRAAREGDAWPEPPPVQDGPSALPAGLDGRWTGPGGRVLTIAGDLVTLEGVTGRLVPGAPDAVTALHPCLDRYPLTLDRPGGRLAGLWSGDAYFAAPGVKAPPPAPERLAGLAGRYDSDDPWSGGPKRVVARADGLWLDGADKLIALADGSWRVGEEAWSPERVRFEAPLDGRPQRMVLSGHDFVRRAEPPAFGEWVKVVKRL